MSVLESLEKVNFWKYLRLGPTSEQAHLVVRFYLLSLWLELKSIVVHKFIILEQIFLSSNLCNEVITFQVGDQNVKNKWRKTFCSRVQQVLVFNINF